MSRGVAETLMGALVLAVAIGFIVFAYTRSSVASVDGYEISAKFTRVDGLLVGADVRVGGIKVGSILAQELDPITYQAIVRFTMADNIKLPADSGAAVVSDGLLGGKYLKIDPGGADELIEPGGEILYTQSSILIDQLIGKFVFGGDD